MKFRVWSHQYKMFTHDPRWPSNQSVHEKFTLDSDGSVMCLVTNDFENYFHYLTDDKDYVVQMGTGIKDKNGKEIYEGDIIKGPHDFGPGGWHERTGVVEFHDFHGYSWEYWSIKEIEVIGNIFDKTVDL